MSDRARPAKYLLLFTIAAILLAAAVVSLTVGRYSMPVGTIFELIALRLSGSPIEGALVQANAVLFALRIPRVLLAIAVGAGLSLSGAAYQSMFQNPMVSQDILGVTHGAGVGAAVGILLNLPTLGVHMMSFCVGIGAVALVLSIARLVGGTERGSLTILVLTGMVITFFFQSLTSLTKYVADTDNKLPEITFWLMGSFARSNSYRNAVIMMAVLVLGATPLFALRWKINVLSFGDEEAKSMGVNVRVIRLIVIACSTMMTASAVCLCGTISWVGLVIPHIIRMIAGPNNDVLFPASMLAGGLFLLIVDNFSRVIVPGELPISILTSMVGAPIFIYMLFQGRRKLL
ncbi:MAG: iron ABC transporter permease [Synergistaceae bacterium]|jgi:iron complex transport system permease protein|nr:iron ABC transporter permease [Synergistaceae bacterium]